MNKKEFDAFMPNYINNNYQNIPSEFYLKDIIPSPQSHVGLLFRKAVDNGEFPNIECIGRIGDADKYRQITISK